MVWNSLGASVDVMSSMVSHNDDVRLLVAQLRSDFENHVKLCEQRWHVAWRFIALLGGAIALGATIAVEVWG